MNTSAKKSQPSWTQQADGHGRSRRRRSMEEAVFHAAVLQRQGATQHGGSKYSVIQYDDLISKKGAWFNWQNWLCSGNIRTYIMRNSMGFGYSLVIWHSYAAMEINSHFWERKTYFETDHVLQFRQVTGWTYLWLIHNNNYAEWWLPCVNSIWPII